LASDDEAYEDAGRTFILLSRKRIKSSNPIFAAVAVEVTDDQNSDSGSRVGACMEALFFHEARLHGDWHNATG
jgi:hypothetical protein